MKHEREKRSLIGKAIVSAVAVLCVLAIAIANLIVPFRNIKPVYALPERRTDELRIHFLDVGQGDCSVVEFPDGSAIVIDAGDGSWEHTDKLFSFFGSLNAAPLTYVATHADLDHCGGMAELIRRFGAETVYLPAIGADYSSYRNLLEAANESGAEVKTAKRYTVIGTEEAYAVFLTPYSQGETDENDASSVLYLRYGEISAVFSADISAKREDLLRREYGLDETLFDYRGFTVRLDDVDILKTSHHGSDAASSADWLHLISPEVAVISCGRGNPYGHPSGGALNRLTACGAEIYRTDELGDIRISAFPDGNYEVVWQ